MSKNLSELCTFLVDEVYGHLPSRLFSILLTHGRVPLPVLIQRARSPPRYVKSGLVILVQNQLVLYYISDEDNVAHYEANTRNAYDLLRIGKDVHNSQISFRTHDHAAYVVENLLFQGPSSAGEVFESFKGPPRPKPEAVTNGRCNGDSVVNGDNNHVDSEEHHFGSVKDGLNGDEQHAVGEKRDVEILKDHNENVAQQDPPSSTGEATRTPEQLFTCRYALRARQLDYMPDYDYDRMVEEDVLMDFPFQGVVKGKEHKAQYAKAVEAMRFKLLRNNKVNHAKIFGTSMAAQPQHRKRAIDTTGTSLKTPQDKVDTSDRPSKLRKLNQGRGYDANGHQYDETSGTGTNVRNEDGKAMAQEPGLYHGDDVAIRMNHDKFDMMRRHNRLTALASRTLGEAPAKVYAALLRCVTKRVHRCFDEVANEAEALDSDDENEPPDPSEILHGSAETSPEISMSEIIAELDVDDFCRPVVDPSSEKAAKVNVEIEEPKNGKHKIALGNVEEDMEHAVDDKKTRLSKQIKQALGTLSEPPHHFVHATIKEAHTGYRVNFPKLCAKLIQLELERIINARFGSIATRVVRYLRVKGRIEEKYIASSLLLQLKDIRLILSLMQACGLVDMQEIPRDTGRQPNRTIWLWFFDQERARRLVLEDTYKTMCRLLQRMRVEREKVQGVVDKGERTDVREDPTLLSAMEAKVLHEWEEREEKMFVQLARLDDLVATLRDFLPPAGA